MLNYTKFFGQVDADKMIGKSGERVGYPRKHTMGFVVAKKSDERTGEKICGKMRTAARGNSWHYEKDRLTSNRRVSREDFFTQKGSAKNERARWL
ncbi:MAG: hypothetical protein J5885_00905 [Clostridia bacterium]|nr:hypothetical protein [Clostridia bacterium]